MNFLRGGWGCKDFTEIVYEKSNEKTGLSRHPEILRTAKIVKMLHRCTPP